MIKLNDLLKYFGYWRKSLFVIYYVLKVYWGGPKKLTIFGDILGPKKKYFPNIFLFYWIEEDLT